MVQMIQNGDADVVYVRFGGPLRCGRGLSGLQCSTWNIADGVTLELLGLGAELSHQVIELVERGVVQDELAVALAAG